MSGSRSSAARDRYRATNQSMLIALRSLIFNTAFYANLIVQMVVLAVPYFLGPRKFAWLVPKNWVRSSLWLQKVIVGTHTEFYGLETLPHGSYILAPKHQSFWDAIAFIPCLPDPVYILKRELRWIPLFGWYIMRMRLIPVDRGSGGKALRQALAASKIEMARGRQLIIYPEGTRRPPGAEPAYKYGIAELYAQLKVPVVPVAHQAGLYWPRRKFLRYPGTIKVKFLPAIPVGLSRDAFLKRLVNETERGCDEILIETASEQPHLPLPPTALLRLQQLKSETASLAT